VKSLREHQRVAVNGVILAGLAGTVNDNPKGTHGPLLVRVQIHFDDDNLVRRGRLHHQPQRISLSSERSQSQMDLRIARAVRGRMAKAVEEVDLYVALAGFEPMAGGEGFQ
jgi:hypothetical protein